MSGDKPGKVLFCDVCGISYEDKYPHDHRPIRTLTSQEAERYWRFKNAT